MSRFTFQFFTPILLFLLMLLDGQITSVAQSLSGGTLTPVSHLMLIFLVYSITQHRHSYMVIVALFLGIIYDSYYVGIYGIATLLFPLIALFVYNIQSTVFTNRWTRLFTIIIIISSFEVASAVITSAFGFSSLNFINFVVYQLAPTLILNIFFAFVLQYPLEYFYKLKKSHPRYKLK
ncbi:MAG: rod shape-determining protein MreD [Lactococcus sp.]|uniref:rod shape-determining protein MreD n=1 Tax=Lactococcus sp. TaxID=44273 RepID=UPI0035B04C36